MKKTYRFVLPSLLVLGLSACSHAPFLYKQDITQGNIFTQEQVNQIQVGMSREMVRQILGTPTISDPFHADIDDYIFSFKSGHTNHAYQRSLRIQYVNNIVSAKTETPINIKTP